VAVMLLPCLQMFPSKSYLSLEESGRLDRSFPLLLEP